MFSVVVNEHKPRSFGAISLDSPGGQCLLDENPAQNTTFSSYIRLKLRIVV